MFRIEFLWLVHSNYNFVISGSSLTVKQATKATSSSTNEEEEEREEEEPAGVITLAVPTISSSSESSDYLVTTYNSVTGYETSV